MPSSLRASKQAGIAVHSSEPQKIHSRARCRSSRKSSTTSTCPIAAGGIGDARGVVAALALGAEGVQMGTVFLACEESGASLLHRQALSGKKAGHTALTKGFTGRLAR